MQFRGARAGVGSGPTVTQSLFWRSPDLVPRRTNLAADLWVRLDGQSSDTAYSDGHALFFERRLSEEEIPDFSEHLNHAIDDLIAIMAGAGGLKRHLVNSA